MLMLFSGVVMFFIAFGFAILIWFISRKFAVEVNPKLEKILEILPGLNCGACGFASCENMAGALLEGKEVSCPVGGREKMRLIYKILGREMGDAQGIKKAFVFCSATDDEKKFLAEYRGVKTCKIANLYSFYQACIYGCLGFGDCARVCPVSAITVKNGRAEVDIDKCIGCGLCVDACPRGVIKLLHLESDFLVAVACSNKDRAKEVKEVCSRGCIGCGLCVKLGPPDGFVLQDGLAVVNVDKLKDYPEEKWLPAIEKCPVKVIMKEELEKVEA